jgi:hypothetical protein
MADDLTVGGVSVCYFRQFRWHSYTGLLPCAPAPYLVNWSQYARISVIGLCMIVSYSYDCVGLFPFL